MCTGETERYRKWVVPKREKVRVKVKERDNGLEWSNLRDLKTESKW